jgi:hypothetical protein
MTATATASATAGSILLLCLSSSATSTRAEGNSLSTNVFIWGAQLVEGTDAKPYFATTNRQDVPRLDYRNADGSLNSCPRLLLEPQRTNSIRNSTMVGAVAGSPGTVPNNWQIFNGGLTQTVVGIGIESGLQYIDLRFNGTAVGSSVEVRQETPTQIAASNGQIWSFTNYVKLISGSFVGLSLGMYERTSAGVVLTSGFQNITATSSLQRFSYVRTLNGGVTVGAVQTTILFGLTIGAAYDFTIRIAAPQMELGAYASTFIPTTTAAVTRVFDVASRNNLYTNGLISPAGGTWFIHLLDNLAYTRDTASGLEITNTGFTQRIIIFNTGGAARLTVFLTTAGVAFTTTTSNVKLAIKWNGSNASVFANGVRVANNVTFTGLNMENLIFGYGVPFNISQSALFPTPLTDAQCIQLTT